MDFTVGEVFRRKVAVVDETSGVEESIIFLVGISVGFCVST